EARAARGGGAAADGLHGEEDVAVVVVALVGSRADGRSAVRVLARDQPRVGAHPAGDVEDQRLAVTAVGFVSRAVAGQAPIVELAIRVVVVAHALVERLVAARVLDVEPEARHLRGNARDRVGPAQAPALEHDAAVAAVDRGRAGALLVPADFAVWRLALEQR